jgi:DNA-binding MarR family transcriptional regulator
MADWSFLTSHARVLPCIAHDPGVWLRDIAARTGVTERTAYGIVTDLTQTGYVAKHEDRRRNRSQIKAHLPLPGTDSRERAIGEILALLAGAGQAARAADLLREHLASIGCDPSAIRITARLQPAHRPGRRLRGPGQPASRLSRHPMVQCSMTR